MNTTTASLRAPDAATVRDVLGRLALDAPLIDVPAARFFGDAWQARHASVLIPWCDQDNRAHILLTRRSPHLSRHAGEWSFPGGTQDPEDADLLATALREAHEEVAIHPDHITQPGWLASVPTLTGFQMAAFTGELPHPYVLRAEPSEVSAMELVSLDALLAPGIHSVVLESHLGHTLPIHSFELGPKPVWGATAYLIYELFKLLGVELGEGMSL